MAPPDTKEGLVSEFRQKLDARIEELQPHVREYQELTDTRDRLDGKAEAPVEAQAPQAPNGGQRRGRRGTRQEELLKVIQGNPGISVAEAAKQMGLNQANYAYRLVAKLEDEKAITKKDGGLHPVSA